ncbi:hypothetical protein BYT27DRAFT_7254395 [Phlegmacium glaucopus]|nr:hypothetical protein BYT27DRAFT_7254395 [Phlegmacium glaucopus]
MSETPKWGQFNRRGRNAVIRVLQDQTQRRGKEDLSEYQVPVIENTTPGGSAIPTVIPAPAPASTSAASTSAQAIATPATAETCRRGYGGNIKKVRKRKFYDDDSDVHRVSSRSETD